jgi:hypothetical protein
MITSTTTAMINQPHQSIGHLSRDLAEAKNQRRCLDASAEPDPDLASSWIKFRSDTGVPSDVMRALS